MKKAIILLSGGLDSAVTLFLARKKGYKTYCLVFDYGQRHKKEIAYAKKIAAYAGARCKLIKLRLPRKKSSLLNRRLKIPSSANLKEAPKGIPSTYVPARNIIFLSFALSYAENLSADSIFLGAHVQDYSGYPDCRPRFFEAFAKAASAGTKSGGKIKILAPLINKKKKDIVALGKRLGVPFHLTWSCYKGGVRPCGVCDSCLYRIKGFEEAGVIDG